MFQEVSDNVGENNNDTGQNSEIAIVGQKSETVALDEEESNKERLPIGTRVRCVYQSFNFESMEQALEVKRSSMNSYNHDLKYKEHLGVIGGYTDQKDQGEVIYR